VSDDPATIDEHAGEERVRFCLACGQLVAYAERTCPSCGHVVPIVAGPAGSPRAACRSCGQAMPERLLHCPACGADVAPPRLPPATSWATPPAGGVEPLSVALALLAPALVLIALLTIVLGAVGGRSG
jgi:RNA polymerase subunit RPABC4/transcription elongation factor Spt4